MTEPRLSQQADSTAIDDDCRDLPEFTDSRAPRILQYMLAGWTFDQIAGELKCSLRTVFNIRRDERLDEIADMLTIEDGKATIRAYLAMRREAFKRNAELIGNQDAEVAQAAINAAMAYVSKRESGGQPPDPRTVHAQRRATALPANTQDAASPGKVAAERLRKR